MLRNKNNNWNLIRHLFSVILAVGIYFLILCRQNVYPFGDRTMIVWDMNYQFSSFYSWFSEVLRGNTTFLFSLEGGLGENMLGLYAYYLSSPLNILLAFFNVGSMPMAVFVLMSIKIGLATAFMSVYLNYKYENGYSIIFACFYSLCSYSLCFQYNLMWMDCFALLPLVVMGIELFIKNSKVGLYVVTLALCIFSNYYIAFMICIFSAIYYLTFYYSEKHAESGAKIVKQLASHMKFAAFSLLAVCLNGMIILPSIYVLRISSSERVIGISDIFNFEFLIEPLKMVKYIYSGAFDSGQGITGEYPMIYAGAVCVLLSALYFLSDKVLFRKKIEKVFLLTFLMIGFVFKGPNTVWHGMTKPSGCPERFAFLWVFLILNMSYKMLMAIKKTKKTRLVLAVCIDIGSIIYISLSDGFRLSFVLNVLFGVSIIGTFLIYVYKKNMIKYLALFLGMSLCVIELLYNGIKVHEYQFEDLYLGKSEYDYYVQMYKSFKEIISDSPNIYRVISKDSLGESFNKGFEYSFNSINMYASTEDTRAWKIYEMLGLGTINFESTVEYDQYANKVASDILGVHYAIAPEGGFAGLDECETIDGISLYENEDALPLLFPVNDMIFDVDKETDLYKRLNRILNSLGENSDVEAYTVMGLDAGLLDDIPEWQKEKDNQIYLIDNNKCTDKCFAAIQNSEIISKKMQTVNNLMESVNVKNNSIYAKVNMNTGGYICASILNDEGWRVYVDGQEVEKTSVIGGMIAFEVEKGEHQIELKFIPQGFIEGIGLSVLSLSTLIVLHIIRKRRVCL